MAKSSSRDYFGLDPLVSLILAIIPPTCWICGFISRFKEGKIVAGIIRIFLTFPVLWILDIVFMIMKRDTFKLLDM